MMSWSTCDSFFVNARLEVYSVNLFSEPLELIPSTDVVYDGPKGDDFKRFLRSRNLRVNCQGRVIVRFQRRDDEGEFVECQYDSFLLETVVPLSHFGFQNIPLPKPQVVNELQILLDNANAELTKKDDALSELRSCLNNTKDELANMKAELAKKNHALDDLMKQRKTDIQDWNSEQFRLIMIVIANSMKRVFVDLGLEPPTNGDPESVLRFLEMLHGMIIHQELGATFLVAANQILTSIGSIFEKRTGLSVGMETTNSSTVSTPALLIKNLFTLRSFLVDSHFFIDGSIIVKDFRLINEDDLPLIFRDSATDVGELKQKEVGAKSIDSIDTKSIFYGYFNIPAVGMFKGVLTRIHVNLPDEIMVKLRVGKHTLDDKRSWFVNANGSAIFQSKSQSTESVTQNPEVVKFAPSRVLGDQNNFFEFFRRMNRTFVNKKGKYLKFDFTATNSCEPRHVFYDSIGYLDKHQIMSEPFKLVQFDSSAHGTDIEDRRVLLPKGEGRQLTSMATDWIVNGGLSNDCAFTFKNFCFIGKITESSGTFRKNALVTVFFEQSQHGENCYVDALATTFFVLNIEEIPLWKTVDNVAPRISP